MQKNEETMSTQQEFIFKECYIMQHDHIERFATTLADGFSQYGLFQYICNDTYDYDRNSFGPCHLLFPKS